MIPEFRKPYNEFFTEARYQAFLEDLNSTYDHVIGFRVAETPIFINRKFKERLFDAASEINAVLMRPDFKELTQHAVPPQYNVPGEDAHPLFFVVDFAVCRDEQGELIPQMIEFQGCPSLYCYQDLVASRYRKHFPVPDQLRHLFHHETSEAYYDFMRKVILGKHKPENVILMELNPDAQYTKIDFLCHEDKIGIQTVCITKVIQEGRKLFYLRNGVKTPIYRIYNRTIFDDLLQHPELTPGFDLTREVDVEWAGHPNWFFRISKYTMPLMRSRYIPETHFLHEYDTLPEDLENYVLKPLFSFAGTGVVYDVTKEDIDIIPQAKRPDYILQRKVIYEPVVQAPDGMVKCEVRLLFVWPEEAPEPILVTNLSRLSRGKLIGVKYNKDKTWVGGSVCFFE